MRFAPHPYQARAVAHLHANKAAALFLDPGLGKTVIALTAIRAWLESGEITGALIVAPLRVCQLTWPQEIAKWDHTRTLTFSSITGSEKHRRAALTASADIYIINYDNLIWLADVLADMKSPPFDAVIWDESSKMKSAKARRFKLLKPHYASFKRRVIMTGTPAPQSYLDLWPQFYVIDQGARLGQFITHFKDRHFQTVDRDGWVWKIKPGHAKEIRRRIADATLCLRAADYLNMPQLIVNVVPVALPESVRDQYQALEKDMFLQAEGKSVEAMNAASLTNKCRQFTGGALYTETREVVEIHSAKLDALADLVDELSGEPAIVAYEYQHEAARLKKLFPDAPIIGGGTPAKAAEKIVADWNAGRVPVLLAHPASIGHGINLQFGGHVLIWFSLSWSLELYEQTIARLYRQGQTHPVIVHVLTCSDTVDVAVAAAIRAKAQGQDGLRAALSKYKAAKGKTP